MCNDGIENARPGRDVVMNMRGALLVRQLGQCTARHVQLQLQPHSQTLSCNGHRRGAGNLIRICVSAQGPPGEVVDEAARLDQGVIRRSAAKE
jgi:hypothetical protein